MGPKVGKVIPQPGVSSQQCVVFFSNVGQDPPFSPYRIPRRPTAGNVSLCWIGFYNTGWMDGVWHSDPTTAHPSRGSFPRCSGASLLPILGPPRSMRRGHGPSKLFHPRGHCDRTHCVRREQQPRDVPRDDPGEPPSGWNPGRSGSGSNRRFRGPGVARAPPPPSFPRSGFHCRTAIGIPFLAFSELLGFPP